MAKIQIKYENEIEKIKILEVLSKGIKINKISKPSKTGRYYRVMSENEKKFHELLREFIK